MYVADRGCKPLKILGKEKKHVTKVTVIKAAKAQKHTQEERRLKVCGYARVSTGSQAQATSYTAQVEELYGKIESNPCGRFAGVYADKVNQRNKRKAQG